MALNEKQIANYQKEITPFLLQGEKIESLYGLILDFSCVTNKRIMFVDRTFGSKKLSVISIPFSKITAISIAKGGFLSFVDEIEIHVGTQAYELRFVKGQSVIDFYNAVVKYMCS